MKWIGVAVESAGILALLFIAVILSPLLLLIALWQARREAGNRRS